MSVRSTRAPATESHAAQANAQIPRCDPRLILAVDLDGTFLGGTAEARRALYGLIEARRADIKLIFVTGRDIAFAASLPRTGETPMPEIIIGDVGTSAVVAPGWTPHVETDAWIAARWPGEAVAAEIMARHPRLEPQPVVGGRRLSYFFRDPRDTEPARAELEAAGYDALASANLYFDVLPRGVAKGPTLAKLIEHMDLPRSRVLAAGDTLNDLSLFQSGFRAVAVGNAEAGLLTALDDLGDQPQIYRARSEGAQGILEAIEHFDCLSADQPTGAAQ